jgi:hypothetical protein
MLVGPTGITPVNKSKARIYFRMYRDSLQQSIDALPKWEAAVNAEENSTFTAGVIGILKRLQDEMKTTASELGVYIGD